MDARQLGIYGELIAARFLRRRGYRILETNFRSRFGEIDLIAEKKGTIIFTEVKTRDHTAIARPMEAVNYYKQQRIKKTSLLYLAKLGYEANVRYDVIEVIAVTQGVKKVKVHHIENAFE